jgi:ferritin-like metal-binding protein YciE
MNKENIKTLFFNELKEALNFEEQILKALPKAIKAAESVELKEAFSTHLKETKTHVSSLLRIFEILNIVEEEISCTAMKGLLRETEEVVKDYEKSALRDEALISRAQAVEHYEIAFYGTLRTYAEELNLDEPTRIIQQILDQEANMDKKLTRISEDGLLAA